MRASLDLYRRLVAVQIRSQMSYRISFLLDLLATGLVTTFEFASIALVFDRFGSIQGWSLGEVAFLYGLVEISFGIMDIVFSGFDPSHFGERIRRGSFDQLLLKPINITLQVLGSDFVIRRLGKVVVGMGIFASALTLTEVHWTAAKLLYLPVVIAGMVFFFGGLFIIGATITFWTVESIEAMNILTYGGAFVTSYPMHIYSTWIRRFLTFILPAIFLNYYPALFFLDKPDPLGFPAVAPYLAPLVSATVFFGALAFWRVGIRHYQSTGT